MKAIGIVKYPSLSLGPSAPSAGIPEEAWQLSCKVNLLERLCQVKSPLQVPSMCLYPAISSLHTCPPSGDRDLRLSCKRTRLGAKKGTTECVRDIQKLLCCAVICSLPQWVKLPDNCPFAPFVCCDCNCPELKYFSDFVVRKRSQSTTETTEGTTVVLTITPTACQNYPFAGQQRP